MLKSSRRNIIILLSAVFLTALSFFTASSTIKAKAVAQEPEVTGKEIPTITECSGIPEDAEKIVANYDGTDSSTLFQIKRYIYFQFNGTALKIAPDSCCEHINIAADGTGTLCGDQNHHDETLVTINAGTLKSGKYYCVDEKSVLDCIGCSGRVASVTGDMYTSNTAPTPVSTEPEVTITEAVGLPSDAVKMVADFDTDGTTFDLKNYIYFLYDGTARYFYSMDMTDKHFEVKENGEAWTTNLPYLHADEQTYGDPVKLNIELENGKYYCVNVSKFKNCPSCHGDVTLVSGDLYASDTAPSDITTEPETPAIEEPELTVIKGIPTNGIAVVASELNDGDVVIEKVTKRYIHFKNDGTAKKITDMWDKNVDPMGEHLNSISVSDSDVLTIKFKNATFTKNLERDKFYSLDLNNFNTDGHAWYLSVYELVGEFYTSDEPAEYKATITFDMNGHGEQVAPLKIDLETAAGNFAFATPTAAGYWFVGWYKEDNKSFTNSEVLNANITLRAEWVKKGFTTEVVAELPANARKIKAGDVLTGKTIYLVGTEDGKQSDISCESAYTDNIGNVKKVRLQKITSNNYRDLIYWSFPAYWQHTDKGYSNEFDINVDPGKVLKIDYKTYELGTVTGISDENSLNLYIVDENGGTVDPGDQDNPNPGDNTGDNTEKDIINDAGNWIKEKAEALSEWFKKQGVAVSSTGIIAITVIAVVVIVLGRKHRR